MIDARTAPTAPSIETASQTETRFAPGTLGRRLRALRHAARLDPAAMAGMLGLSEPRYLAFESDARVRRDPVGSRQSHSNL